MLKLTALIYILCSVFLSAQEETDSLFRSVPADTSSISNPDSLWRSVPADTTLYDTLAATDTTALLDSDWTAAVTDTLYPVYQKPLFGGSTFLSQETLKREYSGFAEQYLRDAETVFLRDYAFIGHPDEILYYGSNSTSFLEDGLLLAGGESYNDLSRFQTGSVDSIEFIPSVRGFMYGQDFRHGSINFISKDFLSQAPYSRIKYYEGPFGEAKIDGLFNSLFFRKLNIFADITNRSADRRYTNSELSSWQAHVKAKYIFSDKYNLITSYSHNRTLAGLNGGVDRNSLTGNINETLYDEIQAPVLFASRQLEDKQHLFRMRLLAAPVKYTNTDMNIYYRFSLTQIHPNEDIADYYHTKNKAMGAFLNQSFSVAPVNVKLSGMYEHSENLFVYNGPVFNANENRYSFSAEGSLGVFDSLLVPAVFYRYGRFNDGTNANQNGIGADLTFYPVKELSIYGGYSVTDNGGVNNRGTALETGLRVRVNNFSLNTNYYMRDNYLNQLHFNGAPSLYQFINFYPVNVNHSGITGNAQVKLWKILISSSINYPFVAGNETPQGLPVVFSRSGIFFDDIIFNNNLDLRAGFTFTYWGEQQLVTHPFSIERVTVPDAYRIDFTLSGEIQKAAIIYFTWENLTDELFYLIPYYPMPFSGIKFGVSWEIFN